MSPSLLLQQSCASVWEPAWWGLRETLFYPMVTGRPQGTGLGLPIAQSIMLQHGGLIECDSRPGHTDFKLLIPLP